jgi:hypothetical protein
VRWHNVGYAVALAGTVAVTLLAGAVTITGARLTVPHDGAVRHSLVAAVPVRSDRVRTGDLLVFTTPDGDPAMRPVLWVGRGAVRTTGPWTIDAARSRFERAAVVVPYGGCLSDIAHSTVAWSAGAVGWPIGMLLVAAIVLGGRHRRERPDPYARPLSLMDDEMAKQPN